MAAGAKFQHQLFGLDPSLEMEQQRHVWNTVCFTMKIIDKCLSLPRRVEAFEEHFPANVLAPLYPPGASIS